MMHEPLEEITFFLFTICFVAPRSVHNLLFLEFLGTKGALKVVLQALLDYRSDYLYIQVRNQKQTIPMGINFNKHLNLSV